MAKKKMSNKEKVAEEFMKEFTKYAGKSGKDLTLEDLKKIEDESYDLP